MNDAREDGPPRRLHGRRKGKPLRANQSRLLEERLPGLSALGSLDALGSVVARNGRVWLEIGFGGGEHLAFQAANHPDVLHYGCEPFVNGVAKLVARIDAEAISNIRVHPEDALTLVTRMPDACIERLYILFPDPWPKRRQRKRRFINEDSLKALARIVKPNAEFRFATDIDDYAGWVLARILDSQDFEWRAASSADWLTPWPDHHTTRYETKARLEGRTPMYFTFIRKG
jgi:tRNA (guanine-N7-)-methyltransferase